MPKAVEDLAQRKETLRRKLRQMRQALLPAALCEASAAACAHLSALAPIRAARHVALYAATDGEIDPAAIAKEARATLYPRIVRQHRPRLIFHAATLNTLGPGTFGILAPSADAPTVELGPSDVVLVPGLAFDDRGHRLGYGRGYYDELLRSAPGPLRIGLCHSFQRVDPLPTEAHDEPVDLIITPDGVHRTHARTEIDLEGLT